MKQGRADSKGPSGYKVEPKPKGVNPGAVSYLGNKLGNHTTDDGDFTLKPTPWATEGYHAPPVKGMRRNPKGSQGRY
jgi:hypothetical protein